SSMLWETGEHPAKRKCIVTTPAGCTIDGILELEDGGLRVTLIKAVVRATVRARDLVTGYRERWPAGRTKAVAGRHGCSRVPSLRSGRRSWRCDRRFAGRTG